MPFSSVTDATALAALRHGLDGPIADDAKRLADFLAAAFGPTAVAVLHYGSRAQGRPATVDSAYDYFVILDSYRTGYGALARSVGTPYSVGTATLLSRVLPPNVIAVRQPAAAGGRLAKCCVYSDADFERACSGRASDHFTQGRLVQIIRLAWSRDERSGDWASRCVAAARARTFAWGAPSLPARFTVDEFCRALLRRSLSGEIRPEGADHAGTLVDAQRDDLRRIYTPLLDTLVDQHVLARDDETGTYRSPIAPSRLDRVRIAVYFQLSKARTTLRLFKHVILYDGWLDYVVRKIHRSSGELVELTPRERRWPLIFLWPRLIQYLRSRPQRQSRHDIR